MNMLAKRCASPALSSRGVCLWCGADEGGPCRLVDPPRIGDRPPLINGPDGASWDGINRPPQLRFTPPADMAKGKAARAPGRTEFDPASLKRA